MEEPQAQPFGSLLDAVLAKFAEIALFPPAATDAERKEALLAAYEAGELTDRQTSMLVAFFGLGAA